MKKILLVEDDKALSDGISMALKSESIDLKPCDTLLSAKSALCEEAFDLLILDINLPDGSDLDFLRDLRKSQTTPVILLTANDMETDIVAGLEFDFERMEFLKHGSGVELSKTEQRLLSMKFFAK